MTSGLIIAILAGLGGMFGWGLADFFAKKTIDEMGDVPSLAWGHVFGTLTLVVLIVFQMSNGGNLAIPSNLMIWGGLIFFGVLQAIVYLYVYRGFAKGPVSALSPVFASFSGITAILSILVFKEMISPQLLIILFVLFVGILIINADMDSLRYRKLNLTKVPGFREVALATIMAGLWTLFWDRFIGGQDWLSYTFYMYAFMTITILIFAQIGKYKFGVKKKTLWKFLFLIGFTEVAAYLAISWGYSQTTHTAIVALLSGAFSLPVIILARIFLGERLDKIQTAGVMVVIVSIMLIAIL
jgi:drug/metabolite transporter (DMT)-like permease